MVDEILHEAKRPTVIIMQGDHGPGYFGNGYSGDKIKHLNGRLSIFLAYYLPDKANIYYDSVTPVNSFPLLFNHYFGEHIEKLPDRSFNSFWERPFKLQEVTDILVKHDPKAIKAYLAANEKPSATGGSD